MIQNIITNPVEAEKAGLLKSGIFFTAYNPETCEVKDIYIPYYYGNRLDLNEMKIYSGEDAEKMKMLLPDLNDLTREGRLIKRAVYREYDIEPGTLYRSISNKKIKEICEQFKAHGFNVTEDAVRHNYNAWLADLKSGYRDEENGYHLFTPCGCNPLSFRVTSLDDRVDWQTTYVI